MHSHKADFVALMDDDVCDVTASQRLARFQVNDVRHEPWEVRSIHKVHESFQTKILRREEISSNDQELSD